MDRCFRSFYDALETIQGVKRRKISLWLLDLGGECSGNGISELIVTILLAATAQFERSLISERIGDAKRQLRRQGRRQGGKRPFGWRSGQANGHGRARELIPDEAAIGDILALRERGATLMHIRDTLRGQGFQISHQSVANILGRRDTACSMSRHSSPRRRDAPRQKLQLSWLFELYARKMISWLVGVTLAMLISAPVGVILVGIVLLPPLGNILLAVAAAPGALYYLVEGADRWMACRRSPRRHRRAADREGVAADRSRRPTSDPRKPSRLID